MPPRKSRSLKVAPQHIERVKNALSRNGFLSQQAFVEHIGFSTDTITKFLNGRGIDRLNFIDCCEKLGLDWQEISDKPTEIEVDPDFVGREAAMLTLNKLSRGAKVILIQGAGGVGKTTLAKKYLAGRFKEKVIEFPIAKETADIAPIEGLLEQCLRSLGEEPGRDFLVSLTRLKEKLQGEPMGVLIDNLEPALNEAGCFVKDHRRYLELLRVLADPSVKSVTLITSREALGEGVDISLYRLPSLALVAWQTYFNNRGVTGNNPAIEPLWSTYHGNALAMKVLCDRILLDHSGNIAKFWQDHQDSGVLLTVENLIKEQFDRLEKVYPEAYRLLCRMGCYRYQDVPTVPKKGLFCLLWDVAENRWKRVIKDLCDRSLVDVIEGEYQLHPLIREEAINRLKSSEEWEKANHKAAEFWTESIQSVETIVNALKALEAYYHYVNIDNYEEAGNIILKKRENKWDKEETLGRAFYRLGLLDKTISLYQDIINKIHEDENKAFLYQYLGYSYRLFGKLNEAIEAHYSSVKIANTYNNKRTNFFRGNIGLCYIDLGDYEKALSCFNPEYELTENIYEEQTNYETNFMKYIVDRSYFCSAFIYSCLGRINDAKVNLNKINHLELIGSLYSWGRFSKFYFVALTYKNLGEITESFNLYKKAINFAEESNYPQAKAKTLTGLAELHRIQQDYNTALDHHHQSITILEKIGAKCDLAEAHYQLALTHQATNHTDSQTHFQKAIDLWTEIDAPKQITKVQNAIKNRF